MKPDKKSPAFKSRPESQAECAAVGITPDSMVYLYGFKGARAPNNFVALKEAGTKNVRLYFGSCNEWSRDPAPPIETGHPAGEWRAACR